MSRIILLLSMIMIHLSCSAQQIIPLTTGPSESDPATAYYKDTTNELNKYEGTWVTQYADTTVTIAFVKVENIQNPYATYSDDILLGEIKLDVNGATVFDSTPLLNNRPDIWSHSFMSTLLLNNNSRPTCDACNTGEYRLFLSYEDEFTPEVKSNAIFRHGIDQNGNEYIVAQINFGHHNYVNHIPPNQWRNANILREGEYIFYKQ